MEKEFNCAKSGNLNTYTVCDLGEICTVTVSISPAHTHAVTGHPMFLDIIKEPLRALKTRIEFPSLTAE